MTHLEALAVVGCFVAALGCFVVEIIIRSAGIRDGSMRE
jgi:hypothetical protein